VMNIHWIHISLAICHPVNRSLVWVTDTRRSPSSE
jgi:hypothetical protein